MTQVETKIASQKIETVKEATLILALTSYQHTDDEALVYQALQFELVDRMTDAEYVKFDAEFIVPREELSFKNSKAS